MSAKKAPNRDAKAKRLLLILVPAVLVVGVLQGPKVLALVGGGADTPTEQDVAAAPVDPATAPLGDVPATVPASGATLQNSNRRPAVDLGELGRLGRFAGGDPFVQQIVGSVGGAVADETPEAELPDPPAAPADGDAQMPATPAEPTTPAEPASPETQPEPVAAASGLEPSAAVIAVNGAPQQIATGGAFPSADPVFRLAALDADGGEIGLVEGQFSTGAGTITIAVGETRTLVSQPDGTRFRVRLVRVID